MVATVTTFSLMGLEATPVAVEVMVAPGEVGVTVVGLPSGAVRESRERVRAAFHALGLSLPAKRITINLSPADLAKHGSHYDLPIALGLLAAMGVVPGDSVQGLAMMGELGLDGTVRGVAGCLPAALGANGQPELGIRCFVCPSENATEAAWAGLPVIGVGSLNQLIQHLRGDEVLATAKVGQSGGVLVESTGKDLRDIRGQENAKRAAEIAAAGGHHLLMSGPPGSGKSMLASRLPGLLPPLSPAEALEVSMIHSVAGTLADNSGLVRTRPFRDPHHSASSVALTGGGMKAKPGEMSLAHRGVLFLDELPEFPRQVLETLRQPLETGTITISRANSHVTYPARFQLIAAMNPCPCGYLGDREKGCKRQPGCAGEYQSRLSGPLLDRFDLKINVPGVKASDLSLPPAKDGTAEALSRVNAARVLQTARYTQATDGAKVVCNAELGGALMDAFCPLDSESRALVNNAADKLGLTARGYHRVLRVARTIADLAGEKEIRRPHVAEALAYRVG